MVNFEFVDQFVVPFVDAVEANVVRGGTNTGLDAFCDENDSLPKVIIDVNIVVRYFFGFHSL